MSKQFRARFGERLAPKGQATVEAALLLPVLFLLIIMLCQPAILLFNRMVMEGAAAEACRLLMTQPSSGGGAYAADKCRGYVERRLGFIPPVAIFHVHEGECSYEIELSGNAQTTTVAVTIRNKVRLLPLMGLGATLLGVCEKGGVYTQEVTVELPSQPDWVSGSPQEWMEVWD